MIVLRTLKKIPCIFGVFFILSVRCGKLTVSTTLFKIPVTVVSNICADLIQPVKYQEPGHSFAFFYSILPIQFEKAKILTLFS